MFPQNSIFWLKYKVQNEENYKIRLYKFPEEVPFYEPTERILDNSLGDGFLCYLTPTDRKVFRTNLSDLTTVTYTFENNERPLVIKAEGNFVTVYVKQESLFVTSHYYIFEGVEMNPIAKIKAAFHEPGGLITEHVSMNYNPESNLLVRTTNMLEWTNGRYIVFDATNGKELQNKLTISDQMIDSVVCENVLIVLFRKKV